MSITLTRRGIVAGMLGVAALFSRPPAVGAAAVGPTVTVWKAIGCDCCDGWVRHMRTAGFTVVVHAVEDVEPVKQTNGVPVALASCHTALVDGYVVEGHVPSSDVKRLLAERPQAKGVSVPGMPQDAPGMDMGTGQPYTVMLFDRTGGESVFSRH